MCAFVSACVCKCTHTHAHLVAHVGEPQGTANCAKRRSERVAGRERVAVVGQEQEGVCGHRIWCDGPYTASELRERERERARSRVSEGIHVDLRLCVRCLCACRFPPLLHSPTSVLPTRLWHCRETILYRAGWSWPDRPYGERGPAVDGRGRTGGGGRFSDSRLSGCPLRQGAGASARGCGTAHDGTDGTADERIVCDGTAHNGTADGTGGDANRLPAVHMGQLAPVLSRLVASAPGELPRHARRAAPGAARERRVDVESVAGGEPDPHHQHQAGACQVRPHGHARNTRGRSGNP